MNKFWVAAIAQIVTVHGWKPVYVYLYFEPKKSLIKYSFLTLFTPSYILPYFLWTSSLIKVCFSQQDEEKYKVFAFTTMQALMEN